LICDIPKLGKETHSLQPAIFFSVLRIFVVSDFISLVS